MNWHKAEEEVDNTHRLKQLQQLLEPPTMVGPRAAADDAIDELYPPLLEVEPRKGRMYVAGREPHFRPVTLLQPVRPRQNGSESS